MKINIEIIPFASPEYDLEVALRLRILREPLGLRFSKEELASELNHDHIGAFSGGKLCGCLVLVPQSPNVVKMRQVAVDETFQRMGVGKSLVKFSEKHARGKGFSEMQLAARGTAIPFYLSLGYEIFGEHFLQVGLPHRTMRKAI